MKTLNLTFCLTLVGCLIACGVRQEVTPTPSPSADSMEDKLTEEAQKTYFQHLKAVQEGTESSKDEIPSKYWTEQIKALNPVKVYHHRVNMVIVQRMDQDMEEGIYVYIPISSYLPQSGDDGFEFNPNPADGESYTLGKGGLKYKRTLSHLK